MRSSLPPSSRAFALLSAVFFVGAAPAPTMGQEPFVHFESGPVRPVVLSEDGGTLFVANIPDARVEIFDVTGAGLAHRESVSVGLGPVALALRNSNELWVVNHISDSVSVVDVPGAFVRRTLRVGDEPRDIVFARGRAFVTCAHRGQRRSDAELSGVPGAGDPQFTTPGVGRADVWVFDAGAPGEAAAGRPVSIVSLFGDTPRALAVSPDESRVYVGVFHSGNGTTTINEGAVCDGFGDAEACVVDGATLPGGNPGPSENHEGAPAPEVGLIVRQDDGGVWRDELARDWSSAVRFSLPDYDVFSLDTETLEEAAPPVAHVGTTLFNMAVNPISGALYVSHTDAQNHVRFEGPGTASSTVQGDLARTMISTLSDGARVPTHLNAHIDYGARPAPVGTGRHSLAIPLDMVVSADGSTLYVAAYGSSRIGVFDTRALESGEVAPEIESARYLDTGGGPAGLALDEERARLYVYTRFDNAVSVIDLDGGMNAERHLLPTPEPESVREGRRFLYDATYSSSNGEASCASCHTFGDMDHLAWDLGNPDATVERGAITIRMAPGAGTNINGTGDAQDFHPMKGPMTTQTLRGLQFAGALHWRGDRSVGRLGTDPYDSSTSFNNFIDAYEGLLGRSEAIPREDMERFTRFAMSIAMPPNPVRQLDGTWTEEEEGGRAFFFSTSRISDGIDVPNAGFNCNGCHRTDPAEGHFGTRGDQSFANQPQILKVPHLRNMVQKIGMFGMLDVPLIESGDNAHLGEQIRGFGFLHDGSVDTLFRFFSSTIFRTVSPTVGFESDEERRHMEAFVLAFDGDVAAIVGQQLTIDSGEVDPRLAHLVAACERPYPSRLLGERPTECDLIVKVADGGDVRGYLYEAGRFRPDREGEPLSLEALVALDGVHTFTAVLPGHGRRLGIDRDGDGVFDGIDGCPMDSTRMEPPCAALRAPPLSGEADAGLGGDAGAAMDVGGEVTPAGTCSCRIETRRSGAFQLVVAALIFLMVRRRR